MPGHDVHLVGSIPLRDAADVFETVSAVLGPRLRTIPDGETGERTSWLDWLEGVFADHPDFERSGQEVVDPRGTSVKHLYRLKPSSKPEQVTFHTLRHAAVHLASYRDFKRLKEAGKVPAQTRFQVDLAHPISVVRKYVIPEQVAALEPAYERALLGEVDKLAKAIPHDQLAIQWDVASGVFSHLEWNKPTRFGQNREEMLRFFGDWCIRLGNAVPKDVALLFHLCYGDFNHKHSVEPADLAMCVAFANAVSAGIGRPIALFHMPVPRNRSDDAYFVPLQNLKLRPETTVALGLVHHTDGITGTRKRVATAEKYLSEFAISTECGFGRRPRDTIPELLNIHAMVAGIA
jgi:hypothetical protein